MLCICMMPIYVQKCFYSSTWLFIFEVKLSMHHLKQSKYVWRVVNLPKGNAFTQLGFFFFFFLFWMHERDFDFSFQFYILKFLWIRKLPFSCHIEACSQKDEQQLQKKHWRTCFLYSPNQNKMVRRAPREKNEYKYQAVGVEFPFFY